MNKTWIKYLAIILALCMVAIMAVSCTDDEGTTTTAPGPNVPGDPANPDVPDEPDDPLSGLPAGPADGSDPGLPDNFD